MGVIIVPQLEDQPALASLEDHSCIRMMDSTTSEDEANDREEEEEEDTIYNVAELISEARTPKQASTKEGEEEEDEVDLGSTK